MRDRIVAVLERNQSLCMDDEADREVLADALFDALDDDDGDFDEDEG